MGAKISGLLGSSNSPAPYGAIFAGPDKIIIGSPHGGELQLSDDLRRKVQDLASRYGAYYEGDGKDVKTTTGLLGDSSYKGSWDDQVAENTKGYPVEFLSGLFSNVEANKYPQIFSDPNRSIFDSILSNQEKASYFKDRKFDAATLEKFLKDGSQDANDFLNMSKMPATQENLQKFFTSGEQLMWPENWQDYPNKLSQFAKKFEEARNASLINAKPGVYFAGAGHLPELSKMNNKFRIVGGEKASD